MISRAKEAIFTKKQDEQILVVRKNLLFPINVPQGLLDVDLDLYFNRIHKHKEFHWRSIMETDENYKQIIPLIVFMHNNMIFLMQRGDNTGDARIARKYTIGIGGHICIEDLSGQATIDGWSRREFNEEVDYKGAFVLEPLGLINDDSNDVGKVHLGFIYLAHGRSPLITIKSELKSGKLVSLHQALDLGNQLESWSAIIIEHLIKRFEK